MKISKIIFPFFFTVIIFAAACGDDDSSSVNCTTLEASGEAVVTNFLTTGFAYASDPSAANCASYKAAIESFISYSNEAKSCFEGTDLDELNAGIVQAEAARDELNC